MSVNRIVEIRRHSGARRNPGPGGTGNLPVPLGYQPSGMRAVNVLQTGAKNSKVRLSRSARLVAGLHRQVACSTLGPRLRTVSPLPSLTAEDTENCHSLISILCAFRFVARVLLFLLLAQNVGLAADDDKIPPLRPPRGILLPSFWDLHTWDVVLAGIAAAAVVTLVIELIKRPKRETPTTPPLTARRALQPMRNRPEDAALL